MLLEKKIFRNQSKGTCSVKKWPGNGHFVIIIIIIIIIIRFAFLFLTSGSFIYYEIVLQYST